MQPETEGGRSLLRITGAGGLMSGAALVTNIIGGVSLRAALVTAALIVALGLGLALRRAHPAQRRRLGRAALAGAGAGLVATLAYDASRAALSVFDPSPYNPFEALRAFGVLLAGPSAPNAAILASGIAFHLLNGSAFGLAFGLLLGRRGLPAGVAWGLGLELFQLTLYPGWLDIRAYREFVQISAAGHLVYGGVLGSISRRWIGSLEGGA